MYRCEVCGREAMVHDTCVVDGNAVTRHYCESHRQDSPPTIDQPRRASALEEIAQRLHTMTEAERAEMALLNRLTRRSR